MEEIIPDKKTLIEKSFENFNRGTITQQELDFIVITEGIFGEPPVMRQIMDIKRREEI